MRVLITLILLAALTAACACPVPKPAAAAKASPPHVPALLEPNGGKTSARGAGFGPGGDFVR